MSVSDPFLKTLKLQILELHRGFLRRQPEPAENGVVEGCSGADMKNRNSSTPPESTASSGKVVYAEPVTDSHPSLAPMCRTLEEIFRKGLRPVSNSLLSLSALKDDYWSWIESFPSTAHRLPPSVQATVESTRSNGKVLTYVGRGRLFLREALSRKTLSPLVEYLVNSEYNGAHYDPSTSIIGDEILVQILTSLLSQLAVFDFRLDLANAAFLDSSWQLPIRKSYEMVPCSDLGVVLRYVMGRVVVVAVEPGSVGGEDRKIEPGDVFDEIFGKCLRKAKRGRVANLMAEKRGLPIELTVIKCKLPTGDIFPPLLNVVRQMSNEKEILRILKEEETLRNSSKPPSAILEDDYSDMVPAQNPMENPTYKVRYLGEIYVGNSGGVDRIEEGVGAALKKFGASKQQVTLYLGEKDVIVTEEGVGKDDGPFVLKHSYPEISSCGRRVDCRNFFAYIAGETTCTISTKFICHVFEARNEVESKNILCGIAQGFERTHWAI